MKLIPFLLLFTLFSCGNANDPQKPQHAKNVKPVNLQFFETCSRQEIYPYWQAACNPVNNQDTSVSIAKASMLEIDSRGLRGLVHESDFMIGYVFEEDVAKVDAMLAIPKIKSYFPENLKFIWAYHSETNNDEIKTVALYAVKIPDGGKAVIDGRHIQSANAAKSYTGQPVIRIAMNQQGSQAWKTMTSNNIGKAIAIVIDDHVLTCPVVHGAITGGETEISGNFTVKEAEELAARIYAGIK